MQADKELIRDLARRLACNDAVAGALRADLSRQVGAGESPTGGILAALRRSPLVGANLDYVREVTTGRPTGL